MSEIIKDSNGHLKKDCWCDPYILEYRVQFHRDDEGNFIGEIGYNVILDDFKEYLNECFIQMEIDELIEE